jgi:two-component system sensor histidine kinase YesM
MASDGLSEKIVQAADDLAFILRYAAHGNCFASIADELDIAKSCVRIHQLRYEGRFTVRYDIGEDCMAICVPRMLLQPLVENAVMHGLVPCGETGTLTVGVRYHQREKRVVLRVMDTGRGMETKTLLSLQRRLEESAVEPCVTAGMDAGGVGLANIFRRLYLLHGKSALPRIQSAGNGQTTITISLPANGREGGGNHL